MSMPRSICWLVAVAILLPLAPSHLPAAVDPVHEVRKDKPLVRVYQMIDWIAVEQQDEGGWCSRLWLPLRYHTQSGNAASKPKVPPQSVDMRREEPERESYLIEPFDTAMSGLALLRARNTISTGEYHGQVLRAADYLYRMVQSSGDKTIWIDYRPTPLTIRIGRRAETFATLLFFVTLRDREMAAAAKVAAAKGEKAPDVGTFTYQMAIDKLLKKIQDTQRANGSWPGEGYHVPMLSQALGCWALEACVRSGIEVRPEVLSRAENYAMTKGAEEADFKADGQWKEHDRGKRPKWMKNALLDDDEPLAHPTYIMSARLSILYQADLTNRVLLDRERGKSAGRTMTATEYAKSNDLTAAASRTKAFLDAGRDVMRKTWTTVHKDDLQPCPAPICFTGEDYLSSLMVVDAMAGAGDVEQWFPPLVQFLAARQDLDGGLRIQSNVKCLSAPKLKDSCICQSAGPELRRKVMENKKVLDDPLAEFWLETQCCPSQLSWCSRDRTFVTAAGTMMLLADTPYRATFLGEKKVQKGE